MALLIHVSRENKRRTSIAASQWEFCIAENFGQIILVERFYIISYNILKLFFNISYLIFCQSEIESPQS
jgi:hypothetical protein